MTTTPGQVPTPEAPSLYIKQGARALCVMAGRKEEEGVP